MQTIFIHIARNTDLVKFEFNTYMYYKQSVFRSSLMSGPPVLSPQSCPPTPGLNILELNRLHMQHKPMQHKPVEHKPMQHKPMQHKPVEDEDEDDQGCGILSTHDWDIKSAHRVVRSIRATMNTLRAECKRLDDERTRVKLEYDKQKKKLKRASHHCNHVLWNGNSDSGDGNGSGGGPITWGNSDNSANTSLWIMRQSNVALKHGDTKSKRNNATVGGVGDATVGDATVGDGYSYDYDYLSSST